MFYREVLMVVSKNKAVSYDDGFKTKYFKSTVDANKFAYSVWEKIPSHVMKEQDGHYNLIKDVLTTTYGGKTYLLTEIEFEPSKAEIKQKALAKLTDEEKEVLGLIDKE